MKESKGKHPKQPDKKEREAHLFPNGSKHGKNKKCGKKFHKLSIYYFS